MVTLIIDDYKLVIFLFEKMGSKSIESAIGGLGDGSGPVGLDIKIIEGDEYITGGLFDYIKHEDSYRVSKIISDGYTVTGERHWTWPNLVHKVVIISCGMC